MFVHFMIVSSLTIDLFGITVNSCFLQDFWNVKSVPELLHKLSLEVYIPAFEKEEIDLATLLTMSEKDLESLGLNKFGPRRRLKKGNGNVPIIDHVRRQMKYRCCNEFMDICCQRKRYACTFDENKYNLMMSQRSRSFRQHGPAFCKPSLSCISRTSSTIHISATVLH